MMTAIAMIMPKAALTPVCSWRPSFPDATKARSTIKTRIMTTATARKGMRLLMMLTAEAKVMVRRAITKETIALTCLLSSPRIFDFSRIANTTAKIRRKGRMRFRTRSDDRMV